MGVSRETSNEIKAGIHETWAVGLGLIPLGLAFGLLMTQTGFAWWWTPIISILIFAGSAEFLSITLIMQGVGPLSAAFTGLMVNFRHIFYGLTFPRHTINSRLGRAYSTYGLIDEAYAIASARDPKEPITGTRLLTIQIFCQLLWVIPGIIGALAGEVLPSDLKGMDFALTALFVVLAWESFKNNKDYSLPIFAAVLTVVGGLLFPSSMLVFALTAYFVLLIIRYLSPRLDSALTWRRAEDAI
ncbi:AzlC family ABC transporter permease [Corynebacterium breve]|uniref:AzlC family ABC transporter permease n=1 Tax=Corynebacterium breve TaxID=3049799 RepID=A0ABY8VDC5_9CORY|nr:AzlC family ABC transporter permease [Corynebacterium breve]WIM67676.1 AzlC family ABC transporter permease [Corynebacterium breve]